MATNENHIRSRSKPISRPRFEPRSKPRTELTFKPISKFKYKPKIQAPLHTQIHFRSEGTPTMQSDRVQIVHDRTCFFVACKQTLSNLLQCMRVRGQHIHCQTMLGVLTTLHAHNEHARLRSAYALHGCNQTMFNLVQYMHVRGQCIRCQAMLNIVTKLQKQHTCTSEDCTCTA